MASNKTVIVGDSNIRIYDTEGVRGPRGVVVEVGTVFGTCADFDISLDGVIGLEFEEVGHSNYVHTTVEVMREAIRLYDAQMARIKLRNEMAQVGTKLSSYA